MTTASRKQVIVTVGDPNGIGPEVAVKAAAALHDKPDLRPVVVGDLHLVKPISDKLGFGICLEPAQWGGNARSIDLCNVAGIDVAKLNPGAPSAAAGAATVAYVQEAIGLVRAGAGRGIVACPHSEVSVNASGRQFSGYPSLLSELLGAGPDSVFLMLVGGGMRVVHATLHERIHGALDRLTPELVERAANAAHEALRSLGIEAPRIGIFGINPHAGEGGLFGDDDLKVVAPAVAALRAGGIDAHGPEGADVMLLRPGYDAFVAMYHDQGHIPVKLKAGRATAAMSIGAGITFSSVGHGAAFDIAGKDSANCEGVLTAIRLIGGMH